MSTFRGFDGNLHVAVPTFFRGWGGGLLFFLLLHRIHPSNHHENSKGHDQEINDGLNESTILEQAQVLHPDAPVTQLHG